MVFGLVPGPGLKGSTLFFPLDLYFFRGEQAGGEKIRRHFQPALKYTSPPSAARKLNTYVLRATGSVGGRSIPRPSPEDNQGAGMKRYEKIRFERRQV